MKESPQNKKLEEMLRSSKLAAGGFMGDDPRSISEIIDVDSAEVFESGLTIEKIVNRMREIINMAITGLGDWVKIDNRLIAMADEAKGRLICPWPHPGRYEKRVTTVRVIASGLTIKWSDLNIHLIAEHSFFEGKGSKFRIEPRIMIDTIF
jgi:hypothetical protein